MKEFTFASMSNLFQRIVNFTNPVILLIGFCLSFFINITAAETVITHASSTGISSTHFGDTLLQAPVHFIPTDNTLCNSHHVIGLDEEEETETDEHVVFRPLLSVITSPVRLVIASHDKRERKTEATHFVQSLQDNHTLPIYLLIEVFRI